jgi:hypothetical protein
MAGSMQIIPPQRRNNDNCGVKAIIAVTIIINEKILLLNTFVLVCIPSSFISLSEDNIEPFINGCER